MKFKKSRNMKNRKYTVDEEKITTESRMFFMNNTISIKFEEITNIDVLLYNSKFVNFEYGLKQRFGIREFLKFPSVYMPQRAVVIHTNRKIGLFPASFILTPKNDKAFVKEVCSKCKQNVPMNEVSV